MNEAYPQMHADKPEHLPTGSGNSQPLWQALAKKAPSLTGQRVLAIHCGDGWICRYAVNQGAILALGIDNDREAISSARALAASDRLRYRIMPDSWLGLLTGPYDLILGNFDLRTDDLQQATQTLSKLLKSGGHLLAAVATGVPQSQPLKLQFKNLFSSSLAIDQLFQVEDPRLAGKQQIDFILSSRSRGTRQ